jgi:hypothetical protein
VSKDRLFHDYVDVLETARATATYITTHAPCFVEMKIGREMRSISLADSYSLFHYDNTYCEMRSTRLVNNCSRAPEATCCTVVIKVVTSNIASLPVKNCL